MKYLDAISKTTELYLFVSKANYSVSHCSLGKRELPSVASESAQVKPAIGAVEGVGDC